MTDDPTLTQVLSLLAAWEPVDRRPVRVVDLGGGTGRSAVVLARAGARVTVIDRSADALATLARRADEADLVDRIVGVQADVESAASDASVTREGPFDLVLVHDVLAGVGDPVAALRSVAGAVAPGGWISVVVPNPIAPVVARALAGQPAQARQRAEALAAGQRLDVDTVSAVLQDAGLLVEHRLGHGAFTGRLGSGGPGRGTSDGDASIGSDTPPEARQLYDELDRFVAPDPAYWSFAARLQVLARRTVDVAPDAGG